jgi:methylmalonyl-CoA/ethylmalonyl-CoA epimerase
VESAAQYGTSVGIVVRDLEPVMEFYQAGLGLGPFVVGEIDASTAVWNGKASPCRIRTASAPLGPCEVELIEVIDGRPPHADFLDQHGEGMNHINLDKLTGDGYLDTMSALFQRGVEPFWGYPFMSFCYVHSEEVGGVTFEVMRGSGHAGKKGHNHLGLVVEDTQRVIDFYSQTMGLGPFRTADFPTRRAVYERDIIDAGFRASFADIGQSQITLYQVVEGESPLTERLAARGEGMHHLCVRVPDLEATVAELDAAGVGTFWSAPDARIAYVDSSATGGMTFAFSES